jgi:hypothetical protein
MKEYGIENVRGGTYSALLLPSYYYKTLEDELSDDIVTANAANRENAIEIIQQIRDKYDFSQDSLEMERKNLIGTLRRYYDVKTNYDSIMKELFLFSAKGEEDKPSGGELREEIDQIFIWVYEWLESFEESSQCIVEYDPVEKHVRTKCLNPCSIETREKYKVFIEFCKKVAPVYERIHSSFLTSGVKEDFLKVYTLHPEFVFDLFFFHSTREECGKYKRQLVEAVTCFEYFENMKNFVFNTMDEYEFHLNGLPQQFELQTEFSIKYLDFLLN